MKNLKQYNTFGIDVNCAQFIEFKDVSEIVDRFSGRWYVLGGGSNTLFSGDYDGTIFHHIGTDIEVIEDDDDYVLIRVEGGVVWDDFVQYCVGNGYYGAENLSWIPGSVGASPVQNIGAYGSEAKDIIHSVEYYDTEDRCVKVIDAVDCEFGYRDSIFKNSLQGRVVVNSVTFCLSKFFTPNVFYGNISSELDSNVELTARVLRDTIVRIRKSKLPDPAEIGNGGSFFKNPIVNVEKFKEMKECYLDMPYYADPKGVKVPAGWLIDKAGWKGFRDGAVGVHRDQALVLVNYGGAKGGDVIALAYRIVEDIKLKFGVELHPEINIL